MHCHAVVTPVVDRMTHVPGAALGTWTSVATLGIGAFAIGTDMFVVAGVLRGLAGDLDVTVGAAGLTVTAFALAYAIGAPLLSALIEERRVRSVLIGSLVLFGLFNLASAVAAVPANQRGRALAVILGGSSMAMVLGAPLGVLLAATYSWRAAFGLVAALAAVTALGLLCSSVGSVVLTHSTVGQRLRLFDHRPSLACSE